MRDKLYRQEYNKLTQTERKMLLHSLAESNPRFRLLRFESFERFGMQTDTAVYLCGDKEFVFVPGDTVTLGWDNFLVGMDSDTLADIQEGISEWEDLPVLEDFLRECISPVRSATIPPMLVERTLNTTGWYTVPFDSVELKPFQEEIEWFLQNDYGKSTRHPIRLTRENGNIIAELFEPISFDDLLKQIHNDGFSLPTEDEWEYLCGGGSRTFYRWGDSFDYDYDSENELCSLLELPNQFGLSIAYDPYVKEVVESSEYFLKGGDGGVGLCGGLCPVLAYLSTATYYRDMCWSNDYLDSKNNIASNYNFYRRIVRL